jgi:hypothetical protein
MKAPLGWLLGIAAIVMAIRGQVRDDFAVELRRSTAEAGAAASEDRAGAKSSFARDRDVVGDDIYASSPVYKFAGNGHLRNDMLASLTLSERQEALAYLKQRHDRAARLMLEARTEFAAQKFDNEATMWMESYSKLWTAMQEKAADR